MSPEVVEALTTIRDFCGEVASIFAWAYIVWLHATHREALTGWGRFLLWPAILLIAIGSLFSLLIWAGR